MKNVFAVASIVLVSALSSSASAAPGVDPALEGSLAPCIAAGDLLELAVCPSVEVYALEDSSAQGVIAFFEAESGYALKSVNEVEAFGALSPRLFAQYNLLLSWIEEEDATAGESFGKMVVNLGRYLRAAEARGLQLYADADTYWAPSVNASVVVVVDPAAKTATVILHGDLDG